MPEAFEKARRRGAKVRTVTHGPKKGHLVAILPSGKTVLGGKRGHKGKKRRKP